MVSAPVIRTPAHSGRPKSILRAKAVPIISGISEAIMADCINYKRKESRYLTSVINHNKIVSGVFVPYSSLQTVAKCFPKSLEQINRYYSYSSPFQVLQPKLEEKDPLSLRKRVPFFFVERLESKEENNFTHIIR
jgi:hypothetical protein